MTLKLPLSNHAPVQADAEMMLHVNLGNFDEAILQVDSFIEMAWDFQTPEIIPDTGDRSASG
jgi:hypothetical protein